MVEKSLKSLSNNDGSIVLNQAVRDKNFNPEKEFTPGSLKDKKDLQAARGNDPFYWIWEKDHTKKIKFDPIQSSEKVFNTL